MTIYLIDPLVEPFHIFTLTGILEGEVNFATCVFLIGWVLIIYTAVKEISRMLTIEHLSGDGDNKPGKSAEQLVILIVLMNLIFHLIPCFRHWRLPTCSPCLRH